MTSIRRLALLLALLFTATTCQLVPGDVARDLLPFRTSTQYNVAEAAFHLLIDRHVDRPGSKLLITGAFDAIDAQLKTEGHAFAYDRPALTGSTESDFAKFAETLELIGAKYPKNTEAAEKAGLARPKFLERVSIDGMAKSLKECHTYYLDPGRAKGFNAPPQEYSGIGAAISPNTANEYAEIADVYGNTPAERAGLRPGDRVTRVDDQDVRGFTAEEIATRIRGPEATTVRIVVLRGGSERSFSIVRARLTPPRAFGRPFDDGRIGYVRVTAFNGDVGEQTALAVRAQLDAGARGIVLDVRNNPGGNLSDAVDIASIFAQKATLVKQIARDGRTTDLQTNDKHFIGAKPLVVLVNERSYSGAEIVAAGLRSAAGASVVGARSGGCVGSAGPRELPDGGLLLITLSRFVDAKTGAELNGEGRGVVPDVAVVQDPNAGGDVQLDAALGVLRGKL